MHRKLTAKIIIQRMVNLKRRTTTREEFFGLWDKLRNLLHKTSEYQEFMSVVKNRQSYLCKCGKPGRQVHHIIRVYDDPTLAVDESNGEYVCVKCHKAAHKDGSGKVKSFRRRRKRVNTF